MEKMENMEKITVIFEGGIANDGVHACNYMLARTEVADGDPMLFELYSEVLMPENLRDDEVDAFDAATYPILKEDIINQAIDAGIDANQLVFPYGASCPEPDNVVYIDGKLLYLDNDAQLDNSGYGGVKWCADAHDSNGNRYKVFWDYIEPLHECENDLSDCADWNHPAEVIEL